MINLDEAKININCPKCGFANSVTLGDIRVQKVIICRGCKVNIRLVDKNASLNKVKKDIDDSIESLKKSLNKAKLTIKI